MLWTNGEALRWSGLLTFFYTLNTRVGRQALTLAHAPRAQDEPSRPRRVADYFSSGRSNALGVINFIFKRQGGRFPIVITLSITHSQQLQCKRVLGCFDALCDNINVDSGRKCDR